MDFVRPELRALISEWRDVLIGAGIAVLGLWAGLAADGILSILGWIGVVLGVAQSVIAIRRRRFGHEADGPGIVTIDEGQIAYFGPLSGGVVSIHDLEAVALDATGKPAHWVLTPTEDAPVYIPITAAGTDALFDAFSQLDGFPVARMLNALERTDGVAETLWSRSRDRNPDRALRLH